MQIEILSSDTRQKYAPGLEHTALNIVYVTNLFDFKSHPILIIYSMHKKIEILLHKRSLEGRATIKSKINRILWNHLRVGLLELNTQVVSPKTTLHSLTHDQNASNHHSGQHYKLYN